MSMSERVKKLRQQSLEAAETISAERAELLTDFWSRDNGLTSVPMRRARAFEFLLEHKSICINEGELIVGEKGPLPKNVPTFPELCCHSLEDLDILDMREKVSFKVSAKTRHIY